MKKDSTTKFIGLDVHSKTISVAIADEGRKGEVRHYGTIENTFEAIDKVIKSLTATGVELRFIYEAGPCGFALYRYLTGNGFTCIVTSPAMIPRRKQCPHQERPQGCSYPGTAVSGRRADRYLCA